MKFSTIVHFEPILGLTVVFSLIFWEMTCKTQGGISNLYGVMIQVNISGFKEAHVRAQIWRGR